ncbi:MAG TPA: DUF2243 domain-containing protein [Pedomonas sp.]|uniref:DUF2243 domain-containing protein n=1 Tax=Pedomonas sp. TaxID=2976421 RepID=UPI002F41C6E2
MAARDDRWGGGGPASGSSRPLNAAGVTLGFALGGFFDGILLHQILQWHHLLSGLDGPTWRSLSVQVMADGLFHALMYVIALVGLWLLWKARRTAVTVSNRRFLGMFLTGFGLWHVVDGLISHWLLGLHHIRMDAQSVLAWDLLFFVTGALILVAGLMLARVGRTGEGRMNGGGPGAATGRKTAGKSVGGKPMGSKSGGRTAFMLGLAVILAGAWALRPAPGGLVTAVFPADAGPAAALQATAALDGQLVWLDPSGSVAVLALPGRLSTSWRLYGAGALFVSGTLSPPGCFAWAKPRVSEAGSEVNQAPVRA